MGWSTEHYVFYGLVFSDDAPPVDAAGAAVELEDSDNYSDDTAWEDGDPELELQRLGVRVGMWGSLMGDDGGRTLHIRSSWLAQPEHDGVVVTLPPVDPDWDGALEVACKVLGIVTPQRPAWHFVAITG